MNNLQSIISFINKIDIATIKKGKRIFENDSVQFIEKSLGKLLFKCKSEGTNSSYEVLIDLENLIKSYCNCNEYSYPYPCKHITACFIATKNSEILGEEDYVNFVDEQELDNFPKPTVEKTIEWVVLPQVKINTWQFLSPMPVIEKNKIRKEAQVAPEQSILKDLIEDKGNVSIRYETANENETTQFKSINNNIYSNCSCSFESHFNSICKHRITALMYFQINFGEDYFFKLLDFTKEKNELLAEYGITLDDPESRYFQFLYQNNEIVIESKNHNIIKPEEWNWLEKTNKKLAEINNLEIIDKSDLNLAENIIVFRKLNSYPGIKIDLYPVEAGTINEPTKIGSSSISKIAESYEAIEQLVPDEVDFVYHLHYLGISEILEKAKVGYTNYWSKSLSNYSNLSIEQQNAIGKVLRDDVIKYSEHLNTKANVYWDDANSNKIVLNKLEQLRFSNKLVEIKINTNQIGSFFSLSIVAIVNDKEYKLKEENIINNALLKIDNIIYAVANEKQFSLVWEFKNKTEVMLPAKNLAELVNRYLMPLKNIAEINLPEEAMPKIIDAKTFETNVRLSDLEPDFLLLEPYFKYDEINTLHGNGELKYEFKGEHLLINRNLEAEKKHIQFLTTLHPNFPKQINRGFFYLKFNEALKDNWFFNLLNLLQENNINIIGKEKLELFKYNPNPAKFELKAGNSIDWFDVKIELSFGENIVQIKDLKKAIVDGQEFIKLADGSLGALPPEWINKLKTIFKIGKTDNESGAIQLSKLHFTLIDELSDNINDEALLFELAEKKRRLSEINTNKNYELPRNLIADLRPYQQSGYQWFNLLHEMGWGGCLADDMGLGKTLQAITFIQKRIEDTTVELEGEKQSSLKILIVGPTSLVYNWENEFKKFAPEIKYYIHHGGERGKLEQSFNLNWNVCITSYGTIRNDIEQFMDVMFDVMILDESQAIKNADAQLSKAVKLVPAKQRFIMSGAPVQNNTFDLFAQFDFINPHLLGNKEFFKTEFANAIDKNADTKKAEQLRKIVFPFLLRRTKETVAKDLPEKIESVIYCEMDKYQRTIYEKVKEEYRAKIFQKVTEEGVSKTAFLILEGLTKLRMLCDSPSLVNNSSGELYKAESIKLEELTREIEENISNHKILVFSQFLGMLDLVRKRLEKDNVKYVYLDGSTPAAERQNIVNQFQEDQTIQVFLMSLKAGGVGLTLTAADYVYIVDPWWNPAVEDQAIDRTHRIGQNKAIFAYKMICKDSIEEKIIQLQEKKKSIVKELISEDAGFVKKLTQEDLEFLFE